MLDRFAATFGQAQVLALVRLSLSAGPNSEACDLSFIRVSDPARPPGCWAPETNRILINDSMYDQPYLDVEYTWAFLENANLQTGQKITHQEVIVAPELGHVLVEGMRLRRATPTGATLEALYAGQVDGDDWPHPKYPTNESLATEVGLWALGMPRQPCVAAFRERYLSPLIYGPVTLETR